MENNDNIEETQLDEQQENVQATDVTTPPEPVNITTNANTSTIESKEEIVESKPGFCWVQPVGNPDHAFEITVNNWLQMYKPQKNKDGNGPKYELSKKKS